MRRHPQQARSQRRIEAILDAACQVIGERGFEAATTNLIAEQASTSIGSIYQFFENKEAIIAALSDRYLSQLTDLLPALGVRAESCEAQILAMLRVIEEYYWNHRGFRAFLFGAYAPAEMEIIQHRLLDPLLGRFAQVFQTYHAQISDFEASLHADVLLHVTSRLLHHASLNGGEEGAAHIMERLHHVVAQVCRSMGNAE